MSKRRGLPERAQMRHDSHFVEQLFRPEELSFGRRIPIAQIEANPDQPRSVMGDLSDLRQSIAEKGVLEPLLVRRREDGRFTIISGERRFRAAMEAGLPDVPCVEMDVDDGEVIEIALIENLQRKDLTPFEEADGYLLLQQRHGYTHEKIAKAVGKSRVTVTETLSLADIPISVKDECRRADITSKSFILELRRLASEPAMLVAVRDYASGGRVDRDALREARRHAGDEAIPARPAARLPKFYELHYAPANDQLRVSLVLRGQPASREELVEAIQELVAKIGAGEIDLEKHGRFVPVKGSRSEPGAEAQPEAAPKPESR